MRCTHVIPCAVLATLALASPAEACDPNRLEVWPFRASIDGTADTACAQLMVAGREQLRAACTEEPDATVRVHNPLASGAYTDAPCAEILDEEPPACVLASEDVGEAQQKLTPVSLFCGVFTVAAGLFFSRVVCNYPGARDPGACHDVTDYGFGGLSLACLAL